MSIGELNIVAMLIGYVVLVPIALFGIVAIFCTAFEWVSYAAIEAHYRIKMRRSKPRKAS